MGSCVVSVRRRGTEQELSCGESLENMHGSAARRTLPGRVRASWCKGWEGKRDGLGMLKQAEAERQQQSTLSIGKEV